MPEAARTRSGHRRYDAGSVLRLDFVRTLRELGLDLATIRRVLDREADLPRVAGAHAEALGAQIRLLRVRRSVLRSLARRSALTREEVDRMNRIVQATAEERRRLISEFLDSIFDGIPVDPDFAARLRSVTPELPEDPTDEQVDAWIELADLVADPDFRALLRQMGESSFGPDTPKVMPVGDASKTTSALVVERAGAAHDAGIDPASPLARPIRDELVGACAAAVGRTAGEAYRRDLAAALELGTDPRPERYWQLMAIINGWPPFPSAGPAFGWFAAALAAAR